ncbi:MAG: ABC transporter substrate-binding protein [Armatimonadota bacterium]
MDEFEKDHPGLRVDMTRDDWDDAHGRIRRWLSDHRPWAPDMTVVPHHWLAEVGHEFYTFRSTFLPTLAPFIPAVMNGTIVKERIHGVPWHARTWALYYRPDLLPEDSGPPETWEDLQALSEKTGQEDRAYPIGIPGAAGGESARSLLVGLWGAGGSLYDHEGKICFDTPELQKALQTWVILRRSDVMQPEMLSWSLKQLQAAFVDGKIICLMARPEFMRTLKKKHPDVPFEIAPLPKFDTPVALVEPTYLVILRSSQHRRECMEFLRYVASADGQAALTNLGAVPVHEEIISRVEEDAPMAPFAANLDHAHITPAADWAAIETLLEEAIFLAMSGRCDAVKALEIVQERWGNRVAD